MLYTADCCDSGPARSEGKISKQGKGHNKERDIMMKRFSALVVCMVLLLAATAHSAENEADSILGEWFTDGGESVVEMYKCGEFYCGKITWLKEPMNEDDTEKVDADNPDESKRDRKIIGMNIVKDFKYRGRSRWGRGTIYDPDSGKTYSCKARLKGDKLNIRGFIGVSFLGRTTVWDRKQ